MELPDLKTLDKLIQLCRKNGVTSLSIGDMKVELGAEPSAVGRRRKLPKRQMFQTPEGDLVPSDDALDPMDLLFYSATGGIPSEGDQG